MPTPHRIYIAGPMSGHHDFNYPAFFSAQDQLEALGYEVINPARFITPVTVRVEPGYTIENFSTEAYTDDPTLIKVLPDDITYQELVNRGMDAIDSADALMLLPGWQDSVGSAQEIAYGRRLGKPVFTLTDLIE